MEDFADTDVPFAPIVVDRSAPPLVAPTSHGFSAAPSWAREPEFGAITRERQIRLDRYSYEAADR